MNRDHDRRTAARGLPELGRRLRIADAEPYRRMRRAVTPANRTVTLAGHLGLAEDDGDIHLRLRNAPGQTMIAEMPLGSCVSSRSLWKTGIVAARSYITRRYHVSLSHWTSFHRTITLRGLGFFDEEHGVTGAAPNDVELHPVIQATFP